MRDEQFNRYEGGQPDEVYSKRVRAGKRTYFFDVKSTRSNDYYITITESKRGYEEGVYIKHKIYLYKEDFHKFVGGLNDAVNYVKTDLMPDHDFSHTSVNSTETIGRTKDKKSPEFLRGFFCVYGSRFRWMRLLKTR